MARPRRSREAPHVLVHRLSVHKIHLSAVNKDAEKTTVQFLLDPLIVIFGEDRVWGTLWNFLIIQHMANEKCMKKCMITYYNRSSNWCFPIATVC